MHALDNSPGASPQRMIVLAILLAALFVVAGGNSTAPPAAPKAPPKEQASGGTPNAAASDQDEQDSRFRTLAVGTWQDDYRGKRTMHLLPDGTGTMVVELSGLSAQLFASCLQFDMVWSIEKGQMKKQTLGGRPEAKVRAILAMMGDRVTEPILELSADRLRLLDADGKTEYDWRRARAE